MPGVATDQPGQLTERIGSAFSGGGRVQERRQQAQCLELVRADQLRDRKNLAGTIGRTVGRERDDGVRRSKIDSDVMHAQAPLAPPWRMLSSICQRSSG